MRACSACLVRVKKCRRRYMSSNGESKDVGIRSRCCTYVSSKSQKKQTSENQKKKIGTWYHAVVCRLTLCEAVSRIEFGSIDPNERLMMSESIDETAGTPSVLLAAVTLSMRQQVHALFRWPQLSRTAARLLCVLGGLHQRSGVALSTLAGTRYIRIRYIIRTAH